MSETLYVPLYPGQTGTGASLAVCLSGGGSRALTCALGQLSALHALDAPQGGGKKLIDTVTHISSVSGGSWASVPYTYAPSSITDHDLLITPVPPERLVKSGYSPIPENIYTLSPHCIGQVPGGMGLFSILEFIDKMKDQGLPRSWAWIAAVGTYVLRPFGLFNDDTVCNQDGVLPSHFFSLSADYVDSTLKPHNNNIDSSQFHTVRDGRPTLIVNFNMIEQTDGMPQVPVQATATATGLSGRSPDGTIVGGGTCESFGFGSTYGSQTGGIAQVSASRKYSLCDITGCSSAFFAEWLASTKSGEDDMPSGTDCDVAAPHLHKDWIPTYNYWSIKGDGSTKPYWFSDGGNFDNTGILGLLAKTTGNLSLIAFVNTDAPLEKSNKQYVVSSQIALLFGYGGYNSDSNAYPALPGSDPMSHVRVFQDDPSGSLTDQGQFRALRQQLADHSHGRNADGSGGDGPLGTDVAWALQTLTTVDNPVAGITAGRTIKVLWVYNTRASKWIDALDPDIAADLQPGETLGNFPNFNTATQLCLDAKPVNLLAQFSAWAIMQLAERGVIAQLVGP